MGGLGTRAANKQVCWKRASGVENGRGRGREGSQKDTNGMESWAEDACDPHMPGRKGSGGLVALGGVVALRRTLGW